MTTEHRGPEIIAACRAELAEVHELLTELRMGDAWTVEQEEELGERAAAAYQELWGVSSSLCPAAVAKLILATLNDTALVPMLHAQALDAVLDDGA